MDRIGRLDALLVVAATALRRELGGLVAVEIGEAARRQIALLEQFARDRLEQATPDDLKALFRCRRPPGGLNAADDVPQPVERLAPANAADLDIVGLSMRRTARVGGRQRNDKQAVLGEQRQTGALWMTAQFPGGLDRGAPAEPLDEIGVNTAQQVSRQRERADNVKLVNLGEQALQADAPQDRPPAG